MLHKLFLVGSRKFYDILSAMFIMKSRCVCVCVCGGGGEGRGEQEK
jgi:hypothetical protein